MFLLLLAIFQFSHALCPGGFDLVRDGQCRGPMGGAITTMDHAGKQAVQACDTIKAKPVIILNDEQEEYWRAFAPNPAENAFLVLGLLCNITSKRYEWADGTKVNYRPYKYGWNEELDRTCQPDVTWDIHPDGYWSYGSYGNPINATFYCTTQVAQPPRAEDGCDGFQDDKQDRECYYVGAVAQNWPEAQLNCQMFGANLASIHNANENSFIRRIAVSKGAVSGILIGGYADTNGLFAWADGSAMDYEHYYPGFPKKNFGDCLAMDTSTTDGMWMNADCTTALLPVACVRSQGPVIQPICTGEDYDEGELITSPGFPFTAATPCDYILSVAPGMKVELTIIFLEANSCCDMVTVYDGYVGANVIGKATGAHVGLVFTTPTSNVMKVSWNPNGGVNVKGLAMSYRAV